jgi:translation initiation factor 2B subunit (eIF-2B alpha/beta/delta family)
MQELEVKTYNFAIQGIGFVKSLEKNNPEVDSNELKSCAGAVSIKLIAALDSKENDDFANNLRECHNNAIKALERLKSLDDLKEKNLENQRIQLIKEAEEIIEKLDKIIEKLIY